MAHFQVGIVVLAYKISDDIVEQFKDSVAQDSCPTVSYTIHVSDRDAESEVNGRTYFNKNQANNRAIELLADSCEVIICADVDLLVPPGLVDKSYAIARKRPLSCMIRKLGIGESIEPRRWEEWKAIEPKKGAYAPWNALAVDDWFRVGGWDESMYSWGYDKQIFRRMKHAGLRPKRTKDDPLVHVGHPQRNPDISALEGKQQVKKRLRKTVGVKYLHR